MPFTMRLLHATRRLLLHQISERARCSLAAVARHAAERGASAAQARLRGRRLSCLHGGSGGERLPLDLISLDVGSVDGSLQALHISLAGLYIHRIDELLPEGLNQADNG